MRTVTVLAVVMVLLDVVVLCDDAASYMMQQLVRSEVFEKTISLTAEEEDLVPIPGASYVKVTRPQHVVGNALEWITFNSNVVSGWSWTGYSSVDIDESMRPSRWKFGLIGGELEAMRPIHDPLLYHLYADEDKSMQYTGVVGIHLYKEF